jgi:hypothetical protein
MYDVFDPAWNRTTAVTNAIAATAAVSIPDSASAVLITNTSTSARVHITMTYYPDGIISGSGTAPTTTTGLPIQPGGQIRVALPIGAKVLRTIATVADGITFITPGRGG